MFVSSYGGVHNESRIGEWYADVDMSVGASGAQRRVFESLMAFYPGMQVLLGEISPAARSLNGFFMVREAVGLLPERYNYGQWKLDSGGGLHPLRPELLESCYFLHKATEGITSSGSNHSEASSGWLWAADYSLHTLQWYTWAQCGYAAINVSPQITGGVPGGKPKQARPQAINEMPSFFLSETLKYLYLTFDENNILHQDDDRDWVFTTEAHPIHYVEASSKEGKKKKTRLRQRVKELLQNRASGRQNLSSQSYGPTIANEKWADKSMANDFTSQVVKTEQRMREVADAKVSSSNEGHDLLSLHILLPTVMPQITEGDELIEWKQEANNIAHLGLSPSGLGVHGMSIVKGCPNLYSPSLSWINALNGGNTDYANIYVSSIVDDVPIDARNGVGLLSASHALALLGTGLYLGKGPANPDETCPLSSLTPGAKKTEKPRGHEGVQRFEMGGVLGAFDVSVYAEGNGFFIKQVNSGETIIVTAIHDERMIVGDNEDSNSPYVMVYASTPPRNKKRSTAQKTPESSSSWLPGMTWKSVFTREPLNDFDETEVDESIASRRIVVGDSSGKSFSCDVQIIKRSVVDLQHLARHTVYPLETEEVVKSFPCAPALFGPTMIPQLAKTNGVIVEGYLAPPFPGNDDGCESVEESGPSVPENRIKLVKRGGCTFQTKAATQKENGANAVVVINSESDDLFLMAHGTDADSDDKIPATALITGNDGEELIRAMEDSIPENVLVKVVLAPQAIHVDESGSISSSAGELQFPILKASVEAIQTYAAGGWGVHAMERPLEQATTTDTTNGVKKEWQLYLLQHSQEST